MYLRSKEKYLETLGNVYFSPFPFFPCWILDFSSIFETSEIEKRIKIEKGGREISFKERYFQNIASWVVWLFWGKMKKMTWHLILYSVFQKALKLNTRLRNIEIIAIIDIVVMNNRAYIADVFLKMTTRWKYFYIKLNRPQYI